MRYFDTETKTETDTATKTTIPETDPRVAKFFKPLQDGEKMVFMDDGLPYFYSDNFLQPKVVKGKVVEGMSKSEMLQRAKDAKIAEITQAKKERQLLPVTVRGVKFYGGRVAGQKYDEAFRLAKMMGLEAGNFKSVDSGMIIVDEAYANEIIIAVASTSYGLWAKEQSYIGQIDGCITVSEVEAVKWQDMGTQDVAV